MKILVLTSTFPRWKGDREPPFVYELSRRISLQHACTVLAPHYKNSNTRETIDNLEIRRFRYLPASWETLAYDGGIVPKLKQNRLRYLQIPFFLLFELISTFRLLRNEDYQAIHTHWMIPQGLVAILARMLSGKKIPILCTLHGGDLYSLKGRMFDKLKKFILNKTDRITVVSNAMKMDLIDLGIDEKKIDVIPMGVDFQNTFKPLPGVQRNTKSVLFVGRLVEKKGVKFLIQAMQNVIQKVPGTELFIAGSGTELDDLKTLSKQVRIENNVHFLGSIHNTELPSLYNQHAIVAFPSIVAQSGDREGFGLVLAEALGCECAVVASNLPAVRDIVSDQYNALLVEPEDITALTKAILQLLRDQALTRTLAKKGRKFVLENFDWEIISRKYISVLEKLQS
jgi:glycosyltransferase involved in cell wall biosynthesis